MAFANLKNLMLFKFIGMLFSSLYYFASAFNRSAKATDEVASNLEKSAVNYSAVAEIERETTLIEATATAKARNLKAKAKLEREALKLEAES